MRAINTCWRRLFSHSGCCNSFDYFSLSPDFRRYHFGKFQVRPTPASMGRLLGLPCVEHSHPPLSANWRTRKQPPTPFPRLLPIGFFLYFVDFRQLYSGFPSNPALHHSADARLPLHSPFGDQEMLCTCTFPFALPINPLLLGSPPVNFPSHASRLQLRLPSATVDASSLVQGFLFTSSVHLQTHQQSCQGSLLDVKLKKALWEHAPRSKIVSSVVRVTISLSSLWLRIGSDAEIVSLHAGKGRTSGSGERTQQELPRPRKRFPGLPSI